MEIILTIAIIGTVVYIMVRFMTQTGESKTGNIQYCPNCGTQAEPKKKIKGSAVTEIVLWLFFILPGLIYSIWRLSSRHLACPKCGAPGMIPRNSPVAQKALRKR